MIRVISINIGLFIENYLPIVKRKPLRLLFLKTLLSPMMDVWDMFNAWRDNTITKAYTTGETISMEWYLNQLVGAPAGSIYIETANTSGISIGLQSLEPTIFISAGLVLSEPTATISVGLPGEGSVFGTKTFAVYVPTAFMSNVEQIKAAVNSYKAAGKSYLIIEY